MTLLMPAQVCRFDHLEISFDATFSHFWVIWSLGPFYEDYLFLALICQEIPWLPRVLGMDSHIHSYVHVVIHLLYFMLVSALLPVPYLPSWTLAYPNIFMRLWEMVSLSLTAMLSHKTLVQDDHWSVHVKWFSAPLEKELMVHVDQIFNFQYTFFSKVTALQHHTVVKIIFYWYFFKNMLTLFPSFLQLGMWQNTVIFSVCIRCVVFGYFAANWPSTFLCWKQK